MVLAYTSITDKLNQYINHKRTYHSPTMFSSLRDNALRESNNAVNRPLFPRPHFLNNNTNAKPGETRFHGKYLTKNVTKMVKVKYQRDKFSDENRAPICDSKIKNFNYHRSSIATSSLASSAKSSKGGEEKVLVLTHKIQKQNKWRSMSSK